MDYNDNEYEGQNLHLAGEESSKISSVLRPFALPKFDFDDSLHGHLRFDSLVENEVFLGIPGHEDSHWIEDFSRGSSAIHFSSGTTESCALPRHNNVWSEATSSESVEMLLKAVGQEEMVPGGNIIEESDTGDQQGCPTRLMEINLRQDDKIDKADNSNPSLPPTEVEGQSVEVGHIHSEFTSQAQERTYSSSGLCVGSNESNLIVADKNLNLKSTIDNPRETCGLLNEFVREINSTDSSSQEIGASIRESDHQDKDSDISLINKESISEQVVEWKEGLGGNASDNTNSEVHFSLDVPSTIKSLQEEYPVEIRMNNFGEVPSVPGKGESGSAVEGSNEVALVEPAGGSECGAVISSSGTEIKLLSESCTILPEKTLVSFPIEGCIQGFGIKGSEAVTPTICGSIKQEASVSQPLGGNRCPIVDEDIPGSKGSPEASRAGSESSVLPEVIDNPVKENMESNVSNADGPGNSTISSFAGECCGEQLVGGDVRNVNDAAEEQKENLEDRDGITPPLQAGRMQASGADTEFVQADVDEEHLNVPPIGKVDKNLQLDSSNTICYDSEQVAGFEFASERVKGIIETATGSQPNASAGDHLAFNAEVEATNPTSLSVEGDEVVDCHEQNLPSCDDRNQSEESELEASQEPNAPDLKGSLEVADEEGTSMHIEKDTLPDSAAAGEMKLDEQSVTVKEAFDTAMPDADIKELTEKMEHPASDLILLPDSSEPVHTENPVEVDTEKSSGDNSSVVSVSKSAIENDTSKQPFADNSQSQINKKESLNRKDIENVGEVLSSSVNTGASARSKEDESFTFDVRPLGGQSTADPGKGMQSFPRSQACKPSSTGEGTPSTSGSIPKDLMIVKETSQARPSTEPPAAATKTPSERKTRRGSSKSGKENSKKGNLVKETSLRQNERGDKSSLSLSPVGSGQLMTFESSMKPTGAVSLPTSSLPDLNTSVASSAFFQQPFTDLQQVQLRAQIFIYGSLIQGAAPDEACMVSAFDGGRSVWEPSWRACVERLHGQKSHRVNTETPVQSRSGAKAPDQASRQGLHQVELLSSPVGRASNKTSLSPVVNPIIPLSSPLWNMSTPSSDGLPSSSIARFDYQAISPLHSYQTPPIRNLGVHTTSWPSQAPIPVPWVASSQSSPFDFGANFSVFPVTEPVKLTPSKESSFPASSGPKHVSPVPPIHTGPSTMFLGTSSIADSKKVTVSTSQASADTKSRKRKKASAVVDVVHIPVTASLVDTMPAPVVADHSSKKVPALENLSQVSLIARNQADSVPTPFVSYHYSTSVAVPTPTSKGTANQLFSAVATSMSNDQLKRGDLSMDKRQLNLETFSKVEEAKLQAEEAAAHAAAAIGHCHGVWNQLDQQKTSGFTSDAEAKLASAAVAVAAAASVAKAAAAAAKVAFTAALQAKQMADEAVTKSGAVNATGYDPILASTSMNSMANATPVSILKGGERNNSSTLAISAAREAARKRVEAASAATRQAENLDAIVKAAELAAEAVSHAGKIVSMGDPFSLSELVEAGPDGYWKVSNVPSGPGTEPNDKNKNKSMDGNVGEASNACTNLHEGSDKDMQVTTRAASPIQRELSRSTVDDHVTAEENLVASALHGKKNLKPHNEQIVSNSAKTSGLVPELDILSRSTSSAQNSNENTTRVKEGSVVEVLKDCSGSKKAWFSANVLSMKDGEALVCYTELQSDEGSGPLKEWVPLGAKDGEAPIVRIPHPMTSVQFEGTRKRRRAAAKDYAWSVGDRVDAWVQDCWREGVIAEKNKKDATTFSVTAQGETLTVKVWQLRPTVIWSGSEWIEWCRPGQFGSSQGDTPLEKRPKLRSSAIEKDKMAKNIDFVEIGPTEETRLPLSANEKVFSIGSARDEKKPDMVRTVRSGLQKEGSRVVFGVPKPGKKRKFMDVSKHYVSDRSSKTNVPNDSVKLASLLAPQGSGSRGLKNNAKPDLKEKQATEPKHKFLKSGKPPTIPSRTLARKDDSTSRSNVSNAAISDHIVKGSMSSDEIQSGKQNHTEFRPSSNVEEASGGTMVFSSQALPPENRKKAPIRNPRSDRLNKGKLAPASVKPAKVEANDNMVSEVSEPRRSNRRIQPTSRLLEGLQSSLITSKIPSSTHDKSHRSQNKGPSRGK